MPKKKKKKNQNFQMSIYEKMKKFISHKQN